MALSRSLPYYENLESTGELDSAEVHNSSRRHTYNDSSRQCVSRSGILPYRYNDPEARDLGRHVQFRRNEDTRQITSTRSSGGGKGQIQSSEWSDSLNSTSVTVIDRCPLALVTVMVMFVFCAYRVNIIIMNQYLYQIFSSETFGNASVDTSRHPCASKSNSSNASSIDGLVHKVQAITSDTSMYLNITSYSLGILSNLILGTFSIFMSRKLLLFIPTCGFFLRLSLILVIINWNLDITWFYMAYGIDGLGGSTTGVLLGTFLYTTDITPRDRKRTLGVAIMETTKGVVGGAFYGATGQLIERTGYIIPISAATGLSFCSLLIILALPERKVSVAKQDVGILSPKRAVQEMLSPFYTLKEKRVKKLLYLAAGALFIIFVVKQGVDQVQNLFMMNLPFCFDAIAIGWFLFGRDIGHHFFNIVAISLFYRCLPGMSLAIIGALSVLASVLMYAFAHLHWHIYLVPVLGLAQALPNSVIRGEASRLLGPEYQGPLFACLAVIESIGFTIGSVGFLAIYNLTQGFFAGQVFVVGGGLMLLAILFLGIYQRLWARHMRVIYYKTLDIQDPGHEDTSSRCSH